MIDEPIHVTDAAFEKAVLNSSLPVIVDFWAPWCGPCKTIAPALENIARDYSGKLLVAKINTDDNQKWLEKYNIQGIPALLFFSDGKLVHQQAGAVPEFMLREIVKQFLETIHSSSDE